MADVDDQVLAKQRNLGWVQESFNKMKSRPKRRKPRKQLPLNAVCPLCETGVESVSYKDVYQLKRFMSVRGKIISGSKSGVCAKHQRQLAKAIKRARQLGLIAYVNAD